MFNSNVSSRAGQRPRIKGLLVGLLACAFGQASQAQTHPSVPLFDSRPGAAYTLYLDFAGFTYAGTWASVSPGTTPAYSIDTNLTAFSAAELANIQNIWSRVSEKYSAFNVNVTTRDPAVAAAQAANDTVRQAYYDNTPRMMHTVIGGTGTWYGNAGGVSYLAVAPTAAGFSGAHTNWVFSNLAPTNLQFIGEATAHEDGHSLGVYHQSDYSGNTLVNEYSSGTGTGAGSIAPIMGNSYTAERGLWKTGTAHVNNTGPTIQNDAFILANDPGMGGFIDDGIGHALQSATALPLNGTIINTSMASGVIVPKSVAAPATGGTANYTSDFWSFVTGAGQVSLNLVSGRSTITPGLADPGAMLNAVLKLYNGVGTLLATASQSTGSTFLESLSLNLAAGTYYVEVNSAGDPGNLGFFDMGSYFLSGNLVAIAVPEVGTSFMLSLGLVGIVIVRRRRGALNA